MAVAASKRTEAEPLVLRSSILPTDVPSTTSTLKEQSLLPVLSAPLQVAVSGTSKGAEKTERRTVLLSGYQRPHHDRTKTKRLDLTALWLTSSSIRRGGAVYSRPLPARLSALLIV